MKNIQGVISKGNINSVYIEIPGCGVQFVGNYPTFNEAWKVFSTYCDSLRRK